MPEPGGGSSLMIDELFEAGDDRFLEEVLKNRSDKKLKALAGSGSRTGARSPAGCCWRTWTTAATGRTTGPW